MSFQSGDGELRVCVQQPALPEYRTPFFQQLAKRPGLDLTVAYGDVDKITNVEGSEFASQYAKTKDLIAGFRWDQNQCRVINSRQYDVVVLSANLHYLSLPVSLLKANWKKMPVVLWGHFASKRETKFRSLCRRWLTRMADAVICYDDLASRNLIASGVKEQKVFVAPNSIDFNRLEVAREQVLSSGAVDAFREQHGLVEERTILFISRLVTKKRVDQIIKACAVLMAEDPLVRLLIVGDGPEKTALQCLCKQLEIGEKVVFLGEVHEEESLALICASADLMVYPFNLGLSLLVANACRLPVITSSALSSHGPEASWLRHEENSWLLDATEVEDIVLAVRSLLLDKIRRFEIAENANAEARHRFGIERMVDGFVSAIHYARHVHSA